MKLLITLLFVSLTITSFGQSEKILELVKVTSYGLKESQDVSYNSENSSLIIGNWNIPVTTNTQVKKFKSREVEFMLQRGTSVTSFADPQLRKSWFTLAFKSRKTAKEFIKAFKQAST